MEQNGDYIHTVQYYETDKMGITHHSNYIRWMEEVRVDFLARKGLNYEKLESMGITSAVVNVTCRFRRPTVFSDKVAIRASVKEFNGLIMTFGYDMKNEEGTVVCTGTSEHVFLNGEGRPMRIKKTYPELFEAFRKLADETEHEST